MQTWSEKTGKTDEKKMPGGRKQNRERYQTVWRWDSGGGHTVFFDARAVRRILSFRADLGLPLSGLRDDKGGFVPVQRAVREILGVKPGGRIVGALGTPVCL